MSSTNSKLDNSYTWKWMPAIDRVYYKNINYGVKNSMRLYCASSPFSNNKANTFYDITPETSLKMGYDYGDNAEIINNGMFMPIDFYEHNASGGASRLCRVLTRDGEKALYIDQVNLLDLDKTPRDACYKYNQSGSSPRDYYAIKRIWIGTKVNISSLTIIDHNHNRDVHKWLVDMADWLNTQSTATSLQLGAYYLSLLTEEEKKKFTDKGWVLS